MEVGNQGGVCRVAALVIGVLLVGQVHAQAQLLSTVKIEPQAQTNPTVKVDPQAKTRPTVKIDENQPIVVVDYAAKRSGIDRKGITSSVERGLADGASFSVRVINLNRFRVRATVTVANRSYFRDVPQAFSAYVLPGKTGETPGKAVGPKGVEEATVADIEAVNTLVSTLGVQLQSALESVSDMEQARLVVSEARSSLTSTFNAIGRFLPEYTTGNEKRTATDLVGLVGRLLALAPGLRDAASQAVAAAMTDEQKATAQRQLTVAEALVRDRDVILSKVRAVSDLARSAQEIDYLESSFGPFQVQNDVTDVTINVTSVTVPAGGSNTPEVLTVSVPTTYGFKLDFSLGLMGTDLRDYTYTTEAVTVDGAQRYRILEDTSPGLQLMPMAFVHAYQRRPGQASLALSFGIGTNNSKNTYAFGLSALIGSRQRFILTGGAALGAVRRLTNGQRPGVGNEITSATPSTGDKYKVRPFVSLSYNF